MIEIELNVNREEVYREVALTTSYAGAKMEGDERAYDRIFTTDDDRSQLDRFWRETVVAVVEAMKKVLSHEEATPEGHRFVLDLSSAFDRTLEDAMRKELDSFFVMSVTGRWFAFTNKPEAGAYTQGASDLLDGVKRKALWKKRPVRPSYN